MNKPLKLQIDLAPEEWTDDCKWLDDLWRRHYRPPPVLTVSRWADKNRILSGVAGNEKGPWRTRRTPYLREIMDRLGPTDPAEVVVMLKGSQIGGPLALDTPVPTLTGWTTMGEILEGEVVFDEAGQPCTVTGVSPVFHGRQCYRVAFNDGSSIVCDSAHLWTVQDAFPGHRGKKRGQVDHIVGRVRTVRAAEISQTFRHNNRNRYAIPCAEPLNLPDAALPIPPYTLGFWLGDGAAGNNRITTHIDDADEVAALIRAEGVRVEYDDRWSKGRAIELVLDPLDRDQHICRRGHDVRITGVHRFIRRGSPATGCAECRRQASMTSQYSTPRDPVVQPPTVGAQLHRLGLSGNKHIPALYLRASIQQRRRLLQGLMDSDGHITKKGRAELCIKDPQLAEDARDLLAGLGYKPRISRCRSRSGFSRHMAEPSVYYRIDFMPYAEDPCVALDRKKASLRKMNTGRPLQAKRRRIVGVTPVPSVPVRCIEVDSPNNLFLAGRQMVPTHNTECGNNWVGYVIDHAPGPMLYVMPDLGDSDSTSEQRLDPLIEETPSLAEKVSAPRSRGGGNSRRRKQFPGGFLKLIGAQSSKALRSTPARWVYLDEIDEYPDKVGKQGDPIMLVMVRSRTFWPRKLFMTSSPTVKNSSKIATWFEKTDKRYYHLPCPKCEHMQVIEWKRITFDRDEHGDVIPESVGLTCANTDCKHLIGEHNKAWWYDNELGEWRATARGRKGYVGYHINALYSPLGWYSWLDAINEFLQAKHEADEYRDYEKRKVFTNTVLAETWEEDRGRVVPWVHIKNRAATSGYSMGEIPAGGLLLACGVDTQDDRLEALIRAWGRAEESWLVYHERLWGDPNTETPWLQLDELLRRGWRHASGKDLRVVSCAVDSGGHRTQAVYNYARQRDPTVIAIKGANQLNKPVLSRPTYVDVNYDGEVIKEGVQLWTVGSDTIRNTMYARLKLEESGPTAMHYPHGLPDEFFKQLVAKKAVTKHQRGVPYTEWVQHYQNAEVHDCELYAYAAAVRAGLLHADWDEMEQFVLSSTEQMASGISKAGQSKQTSPVREKRLRKTRPRFGKR